MLKSLRLRRKTGHAKKVALLLLALLTPLLAHPDDPPPPKHPYTGILSVKPVEKAAELEGNTLKVRGLMPASGFLITPTTIITARHVEDQSPLALIHTLDRAGQFSQRHIATSGDSFDETDDTYKMKIISPQSGQEIETDTLPYDVAQYTPEDPITNTASLTPYTGMIKAGLRVNVTGIVYEDDNQHTLQHTTGRISRIHATDGGAHILLLDIKSQHGMSGAPVTIPHTREVIGVLMGEYRYPPHRYTIVWSLPKSLAPNITYQPTKE